MPNKPGQPRLSPKHEYQIEQDDQLGMLEVPRPIQWLLETIERMRRR